MDGLSHIRSSKSDPSLVIEQPSLEFEIRTPVQISIMKFSITKSEFKRNYTFWSRMGMLLIISIWPFNTLLEIEFLPEIEEC